MPKPEPTWAQKAQNCQQELDHVRDALANCAGTQRALDDMTRRAEAAENTRNSAVGQQAKQIEFWRRESITAQQALGNAQNRVQVLEKALREAPTRDWVETISTKLGEAELERAQAAQQAAECHRQAAGMVTRLQGFQNATEALGRMEQAADEWQRKATTIEQARREAVAERDELKRENRALAGDREKLRLAGEHIQRVEARLVEVMPAARALPTVRADLAQKTEALEQAQRRAHQLEQALDQAQIDREELATLRRSSAHQVQRLFEAGAELERKQRELIASNAEVRRLTTKLNDARTNLG